MSLPKDLTRFLDTLSESLNEEIRCDVGRHHRISLTLRGEATPDRRRLVDELGLLLSRQRQDRSTIRTLKAELEDVRRQNQELVAENEQLASMVIHDLLTGLYTRWFVQEKIEEEIQRGSRFEQPTSVVMLDLDHFKRINDTYGHLVGDEVLRELGHVIRGSLRVYDVPGRYGGEEFCLMLPATDQERTMLVAERIRSNIESHRFELDGDTFNVTASVGVASMTDAQVIDSADRLIGFADEALYNAKQSGRNRIERWEAPN